MTYITNNTQFYNPTLDGFDRNTSQDLDKNAFLNLLVTQLQNQNPLEPMQDQEFISQLAQFSQLEQLENMSSTLATNSEVNYLMSQSIANTMATTLIGKTVVAEGTDFHLGIDDEVKLSFELGTEAATTTINIFNESKSLVRTVELSDLPGGINDYTWDGKNNAGIDLAPGQYSYEVHATTLSGTDVSVENRVMGTVESVKYEDGIAYLVVGGYKVSLSSIIEIVEGSSAESSYQN
jgi:flagellar basal-body rod modification protein FlgD